MPDGEAVRTCARRVLGLKTASSPRAAEGSMSASPLFIQGCPIRAVNDVVRGDSPNKSLPSPISVLLSADRAGSEDLLSWLSS